jgi:hypothetical protein
MRTGPVSRLVAAEAVVAVGCRGSTPAQVAAFRKELR